MLSTCGFKPAKKDKLWHFLETFDNKKTNYDSKHCFLNDISKEKKIRKALEQPDSTVHKDWLTVQKKIVYLFVTLPTMSLDVSI